MALMREGARPVRILVADDHPPMRSACAAILAYGRGLEVVGEAREGQEAVLKCKELRPDLVLMDLSMPEVDGIEATSAIKQSLPETVVLVITAHEDEDLMLRAIQAGAAGYVLKGEEDPSRLIDAVREALSGEFPMDQRLAGRLLKRLAAEEASPSGRGAQETRRHEPKEIPTVSLTSRELEVLGRVVEGKTNRLIAQELHMSLSTVKRHLERVVSKLGVSDRTQAAVKAIKLGLLSE